MTRSGLARRAAWAGWAALFLQQVVDAVLQQTPWIVWLFKLLPLLMFLPGMLRDNLRSYIWVCFVALGYFVLLVERLFALPGSPLAILGLAAVVLLFVAAMLYVRWRAAELREPAPEGSAPGD